MAKYIVFILIFLSSIAQCLAIDSDSVIYTNHIFDKRIKTVQLYKDGWNLSYPIIKLNSNEKLDLNFDLLDDQPETYYYTFIHCDKDWKKSDIFPNDYLSSVTLRIRLKTMRIHSILQSDYIHYKLSFPK